MARSIFLTGPEPTLKLVPNDIWLPGLYSRRVLCFELPVSSTQEKIVDIFQRALQALVKGTPELGATSIVVPNAAPHDSSKPWRELAPGKGIELVVKDLTSSMPSYADLKKAGFPIAQFKDAELMPIKGPIVPEPAAVSKFQLNFIEGGLLLSSCIYHHLTDGNGMNGIMRALAEECGKAAETTGDLPPRVLPTSRQAINAATGTLTDLKHHPGYSLSEEDIFTPGVHHDEPPSNDFHPAPKFHPHYYYLSATSATTLKSLASTLDPTITTHDAISAALWRALILTRLSTTELPSDNPDLLTTYTIPHNARKYLSLPAHWLGNLTYFIAAQATLAEIQSPHSLPLLAARIRAAMRAVTPEKVKSIIAVRRQHPFALSWWPIMRTGDPDIVALTSFYQSELLLTSPYSPVSADSSSTGGGGGGGGGKNPTGPVNWGPALNSHAQHFASTDLGAFAADFQRAHFVGPKLPAEAKEGGGGGGGGCWVHVGLLEQEVDIFHREEVWRRFFLGPGHGDGGGGDGCAGGGGGGDC